MDTIEMARKYYLAELPFPRKYRPGKYVAYGPAKKFREILLDIQGKGVLKRIWTAHQKSTNLNLYVFADDPAGPVLHGPVHELAAAAGRISCASIPFGGFARDAGANLYLPIKFARFLRIEAEPTGETGDGPYFQIDYALDADEVCPVITQQNTENGIEFSCASPMVDRGAPWNETVLEKAFELCNCNPKNIFLAGPAVIRRLEIESGYIDSIILRIAYDKAAADPEHLDGPFQVEAPLKYLVGQFNNAGVERLGRTAIIHFPMPFRERAALQFICSMEHADFFRKHPVKIRIVSEQAPPRIAEMYYFHARFNAAVPNGYDDFECFATAGRGHFVGMHIFDNGHDHGGGDNIMFDSGREDGGQLHGICGEDYFHMTYFQIGNRTPYSGCPAHSARYRHHLEMPIPFQESFVFNWGTYAGQPVKAVAFWYQEQPSLLAMPENELVWKISGPFALAELDKIKPDGALPGFAVLPLLGPDLRLPVKTWMKKSQKGFIDLCHIHRKYIAPVPPSSGFIESNICACADTSLWSAQDGATRFLVGCDDPIRVFLNGRMIFKDDGRHGSDPFKVFTVLAVLSKGLNPIRVVVGNTENTNWHWNGFSFRLQNDLNGNEIIQANIT